eukprot:g7636.t1
MAAQGHHHSAVAQDYRGTLALVGLALVTWVYQNSSGGSGPDTGTILVGAVVLGGCTLSAARWLAAGVRVRVPTTPAAQLTPRQRRLMGLAAGGSTGDPASAGAAPASGRAVRQRLLRAHRSPAASPVAASTGAGADAAAAAAAAAVATPPFGAVASLATPLSSGGAHRRGAAGARGSPFASPATATPQREADIDGFLHSAREGAGRTPNDGLGGGFGGADAGGGGRFGGFGGSPAASEFGELRGDIRYRSPRKDHTHGHHGHGHRGGYGYGYDSPHSPPGTHMGMGMGRHGGGLHDGGGGGGYGYGYGGYGYGG